MTPWVNPLLRPLAPRWATLTEVSAWLADIPRRIGARLFLEADEEAYWRGWQVTPLLGGLGRSYRDHRFDTRSAPPDPAGQVPPGQAPPDAGQ